MNKKAFLGLLVAVAIPLVSYLIMRSLGKDIGVMPRHFIYDTVHSVTKNGKLENDTVWHKIPDFSFVNQLHDTVGWKDIGDKIVVADFFFTRCPTICPKLTLNMKLLQDHIRTSEKVGDRFPRFVQFLSFSVDPERDDVPALKHWADRFQINPENWWLLTGNKKEIYDLSINHFKLGLVDGKGIDTGFFHTDYMVLIDKNRNIRGYYHGLDTTEVQQLARDIVLLSLEKDPNRKGVFAGKLEMLAVIFFITIIGIVLLVYLLKRYK
ncbi:SCO family protein [Chitinophagaceae bacterium LB-8]|uniref:SCO family protein n=1 Tax=Paraflavisolibacter caeni TaxID=2982496 RepID=A0A9X2XPG2_9BACT|nr:SCO family protein [Paraflavisolibacter caeni]MCU7551248.1 SCO family protein [Paraflavisolibacter caeni]